jgi:hypothetical protein
VVVGQLPQVRLVVLGVRTDGFDALAEEVGADQLDDGRGVLLLGVDPADELIDRRRVGLAGKVTAFAMVVASSRSCWTRAGSS